MYVSDLIDGLQLISALSFDHTIVRMAEFQCYAYLYIMQETVCFEYPRTYISFLYQVFKEMNSEMQHIKLPWLILK